MAFVNFTRSWQDQIDSVRTLLDESSAGFYTDDAIYRFLVDAQMVIAQKAVIRYEQTGKMPKLFKDCMVTYSGTTNNVSNVYNQIFAADLFMLVKARAKYISDDNFYDKNNFGTGEGVVDMIDVPILTNEQFFSENNYLDGATVVPLNNGGQRQNQVYFKTNFAGDVHGGQLSWAITYVSIWTDYNTKPLDYRSQINSDLYPTDVDSLGTTVASNRNLGNVSLGLLPPYCLPAMVEYAYGQIMRKDRELIGVAMNILQRADRMIEECAI